MRRTEKIYKKRMMTTTMMMRTWKSKMALSCLITIFLKTRSSKMIQMMKAMTSSITASKVLKWRNKSFRLTVSSFQGQMIMFSSICRTSKLIVLQTRTNSLFNLNINQRLKLDWKLLLQKNQTQRRRIA